LHAIALPLPTPPLQPEVTTNNNATKTNSPQQTPQVSMLSPEKPKSSLKAGKFFPVHATTPPPCQAEVTDKGPDVDEDEDDPGIYSCAINGVGDGMHLIIVSFIKTNDKIQDQLVTNFNYFYELMYANNDGLQIHPLNTDKSLPILTSPKDKNIPTTGTKIRDYFYIQNNFSLILGMQNKSKSPPQKVDADGLF
jgi:hypothetical protein